MPNSRANRPFDKVARGWVEASVDAWGRLGGVVVAAVEGYFDSLETAGLVLTALAAVLLWPMLLFGFDIRVSR